MTPQEAQKQAEAITNEFAERITRLPHFAAAAISITLDNGPAFIGHSAFTGEAPALARSVAALLENIDGVPAYADVMDQALDIFGTGANAQRYQTRIKIRGDA